MLLAGAGVPLALSSSPANADQVSTLRARAEAIASQIQADNVRLQILDENYLQAEAKVATLQHEVANATKAMASAQRSFSLDESHLRHVAIEAYVTGGDNGSLSVIMNGSQQNAPMQQAYLQAASGNLNEAMATVRIAQHQIQGQRAVLQRAETAARANEQSIANDRSQAQALSGQLQATYSQVNGQLAAAVAEVQRQQQAAALAALQQAAAQQAAAQQAAAQQAAAAAAAAAQQQQQQQQQQTPPANQPPPVNVPSAGGAAGAAVAAAQSQRGVPYVWGGATPGVGFDCSGLTMWAWGQAGVQLPHGATAQYYQIQHVSMSDLQPGDLVFYGSAGYLSHVVMYIGGGMVVQAEQTGTNVMDTPLWPGAYGAGRP